MRFSQIILWLCLMLAAAPAFGQAVVLRSEDVLPRIKDVAPEAFYINGHDVHGMTDEIANTYYPLGDAAKFMLALVALRLADKGVISLDEPVAKAMPDLLDFNPFEVAITPRHLLSESAGFAKPVTDMNDAPLNYYLIKSRGAGQISLHDPIGWRLLLAFLESRTGKGGGQLFAEELLQPMGMPDKALMPIRSSVPNYTDVPFTDAAIRGDALAALARLLLVNEDASGASFLARETHALLVSDPLWQMHPMGFAALAGTRRLQSGSQQWVEVGSCRTGFVAMAFPQAGIVYVRPEAVEGADGKPHGTCSGSRFRDIVLANAAANIPIFWDRDKATTQAESLIEPEVLGGRYQCANVSAWVKERVEGSATCRLNARVINDGSVKIDLKWPAGAGFESGAPLSQSFKRVVPYAYRGSTAEPALIFSPYRAGGYAYIGDKAYVRVGVLGYFRTIAGKYIPLMIVILLTGALHIRSKTSVQWRRFGCLATAGAFLVGFGLYAEWHWWPTVLYDMQMPGLITLWRTGLNVGLMLLLALPMLSMTFIRQQNMPERGFALLFAGPHLGLMSLAAISLFLTTIIWGIAGTFTAY